MTGMVRGGIVALLVAGLVAGAAVLAGCGGKAELDGTSWVLKAWSVSSLDPADFTITATFADGQISGTSAVNQYGGEYTARSNGEFSVSALMSTEMAGPEPAMRAEAAYIDLLQRARAFRLEGGQLTLLDDNGNELLIFAPGEGSPANDG